MNNRSYYERPFAVVEKQFEYKGHDCICIFSIRGVRCGYVSVTDKEKPYDDYDIDCHGGLTFDGELPDYYKPKADYYIGFDCGHICDGNDYNTALKYGLLTEKRFNELLEMQIHLPTFLEPVRSLEYVEDECKKIVDQLEVVDNIYDKNKDADTSTEFLKAVDPFSVYHNF